MGSNMDIDWISVLRKDQLNICAMFRVQNTCFKKNSNASKDTIVKSNAQVGTKPWHETGIVGEAVPKNNCD